jgi:hypothetical protein
MGMKLGRKLKQDPVKEACECYDTANAMRSRTQRPYGTENTKKS